MTRGEKDNYIRAMRGKIPITDIANHLGVTPAAISQRAKKLGLAPLPINVRYRRYQLAGMTVDERYERRKELGHQVSFWMDNETFAEVEALAVKDVVPVSVVLRELIEWGLMDRA